MRNNLTGLRTHVTIRFFIRVNPKLCLVEMSCLMEMPRLVKIPCLVLWKLLFPWQALVFYAKYRMLPCMSTPVEMKL